VLINPVLTLATYLIVFDRIIGVPIGNNIPPMLFYFSGIILWNFFSDTFMGIAGTFRDNMPVFSKVYFPRIIVPLAVLSTHFLRFLIQLVLLGLMILYFTIFKNQPVHPGIYILALPVAVLFTGIYGLAAGLLCSVITAKYRDIANLLHIFIRLLMFITPVIYPLSAVSGNLHTLLLLNPLSPLFELFRLGLLGEASLAWTPLVYSAGLLLLLAVVSLTLFDRLGRRLMDVI